MALVPDDVTFRKVPPDVGEKTRYVVSQGDTPLGIVFSYEGFSYRGSQGTCRGIRLRDFHPTDWGFIARDGRTMKHRPSRPWATWALLCHIEENEKKSAESIQLYPFEPPACDVCGEPCGDQALCDRCLRACESCDNRNDLIEW